MAPGDPSLKAGIRFAFVNPFGAYAQHYAAGKPDPYQ